MIPDDFVHHWVRFGTVCAALLLILTPLLAGRLDPPVLAVFLALPVYMVHQIEEHAGDRFRRYFNETMGGGREALTPFAVMVINVVGVWGVILAALYLAAWIRPGLGLIAVWLVLVNTVAHVVAAAVQRRYNPGTWTALLLFLPWGVWALLLLSRQAGPDDQAIGLAAGIGVHAAIMIHARLRIAALDRAGGSPSTPAA